MLFTANWLKSIFSNNSGKLQDNLQIKEVTTDSRAKMEQALFIPLVGENFDGHNYVEQAINNGAIAVIWDESKKLPSSLTTDFPVFFVKNTLTALQQLATNYRDEVDPIVVGITGSNGKTTTKDLVASVVKTMYNTHFTQGNYNNHIGLPLTILGMSKDTEVLILEMGMSNFNEIDHLSKLARPDYAIITNVGESHIEFLGSREGIVKAKLEITNGLKDKGYLIVDGDEQLLKATHHIENVITCGFKSTNDVIIDDVKILHDSTKFTLSDSKNYTIPLLGRHHALNATYAITLGEKLNIPTEKIKEGMNALKQTSMRFELIKGKHNVSIINDAYNASPTSMKAAIEVVKQMDGFKEKVLILGDIFELGDQTKALHLSVADIIQSPITVLYTYGEEVETITKEIKNREPHIICKHFKTKEELLTKLQQFLNEDTLLLFKASRGMKFETLIEPIK